MERGRKLASQNSSRPCENSGVFLIDRSFVEFWAVLGDQQPADREYSLRASPFSVETRVFTQSARNSHAAFVPGNGGALKRLAERQTFNVMAFVRLPSKAGVDDAVAIGLRFSLPNDEPA